MDGPRKGTMPFLNDVSQDASTRQLRAGARLNSRVPVAIRWNESGRDLRSDGYTQDISPKGCLAVVPQGFPLGQRLELVNLMNNHRCDVVLIWRGHEGRTGWELGLELQDPPADFWGVEF
jgi:PilZ domain-containing protein